MKVFYAKASVERRPEYRQQTVILEEGGRRLVRKIAVGTEAKAHMIRYAENAETLRRALKENSLIRILSCEQKDDSTVEFPFLREATLAERLTGLDEGAYLKEILTFRKTLEEAFKTEPFRLTEEYKDFFGEDALPEGRLALRPANLDMNFDNVFLSDGETCTLIDYEWVVPFPVPLDYVIFRSLLSDTAFVLFTKEEQERVYAGLELTEAERDICLRMEMAFQRRTARDEDKLDYFLIRAMNGTEDRVTVKGAEGRITIPREYREFQQEHQRVCHDLDVYKKAYDAKQKELDEANRQLISVTQEVQRLSGRWFVRLLDRKK